MLFTWKYTLSDIIFGLFEFLIWFLNIVISRERLELKERERERDKRLREDRERKEMERRKKREEEKYREAQARLEGIMFNLSAIHLRYKICEYFCVYLRNIIIIYITNHQDCE